MAEFTKELALEVEEDAEHFGNDGDGLTMRGVQFYHKIQNADTYLKVVD